MTEREEQVHPLTEECRGERYEETSGGGLTKDTSSSSKMEEMKHERKTGLKYMVGVDGSISSKKALQHALNLMRPEQDMLYLVHYIQKGKDGDTVNKARGFLSEYEKIVQEWAPGKEYKYDTRLITGKSDVRGGLCDVVDELEIDYLIIGSRGQGLVSRLLLGSVSTYLVSNAACPVLVVREGQESAATREMEEAKVKVKEKKQHEPKSEKKKFRESKEEERKKKKKEAPGSKHLREGATEVKEGIKQSATGAKEGAKGGMKQMKEGVSEIKEGIIQSATGAKEGAKEGVKQMKEGAFEMKEGIMPSTGAKEDIKKGGIPTPPPQGQSA